MKEYLTKDPWNIIEDGFRPEYNRVSESIFSLGNGRFGGRANFEEAYSGDSLQGNYVAGVYYPDKTKVGWWKNGYPEYFAKVLNAANWVGIGVKAAGEELDLAKWKVVSFRRILNMKKGLLERTFEAQSGQGRTLNVNARRFCSMADDEIAAIAYTITPSFSGPLEFTPYVDFDVVNEDSNYGDKFWEAVSQSAEGDRAKVLARTLKTGFEVCTGMCWQISMGPSGDDPVDVHESSTEVREKYAACKISVQVEKDVPLTLYKYAAIVSSENYPSAALELKCDEALTRARSAGFDKLLKAHADSWDEKWAHSDVIIEGDLIAQQGIRFNVFQLNQTYTGEDERLNIGPKGFTGEKYGGSTYWDTEAYCLPFYLSTAELKVPRNLLLYRYKQLGKAIENAEKLGYTAGAALYPMVTMNGEECHNEWEITFEEIHRNGAIAYAILNYIRYSGDRDYLVDGGLEVLIAIARFWVQRANWSDQKKQFVILGVTGPNEYENNVDNNWYTNTMASWCMRYAAESAEWVMENHPAAYEKIVRKTTFDAEAEMTRWHEVADKMFYPVDEKRGIFLQQENYLDKEQIMVADLPEAVQPIHQHWSWDRILRSCFIKQADVLQGLYFFDDLYDEEVIRRNFEFYEPRTVHESSLSPCVHVILASRIGDRSKAYELYLRTARLDLDDYNNDTEDGCHITSMAGTWMAVTKGFGGMRVADDHLYLSPYTPANWKSLQFVVRFRGCELHLKVDKQKVSVRNDGTKDLTIYMYQKPVQLKAGETVSIAAEG